MIRICRLKKTNLHGENLSAHDITATVQKINLARDIGPVRLGNMDLVHIIDGLIAIIVMGGGWFLGSQAREIKRVEILLNRTREDYATRTDMRDDMRTISESLHRVEDKLDRVLQKET